MQWIIFLACGLVSKVADMLRPNSQCAAVHVARKCARLPLFSGKRSIVLCAA